MIKGFGNSAQGCPSLSLAMWAEAWLGDAASPDAVIDGLSSWAELHLVHAVDPETAAASGLGGGDLDRQGAVAVLGLLRRFAEPGGVHLLLPTPGDTRGLEPGTQHARDAIAAGETLLLCPAEPLTGADGSARYRGLGLIPVREGRDVLRWAVYGLPALPAVPQPAGLGQARHDLREAVRDAAEMFARIQTVGASPSAARARITQLTEDGHEHPVPPTVSARVAEVLDSAAMVAAILTAATETAGGAAPTTSAAALAEEALRALWGVVREARLSAVAQAARDLGTRPPAAAPFPSSAQARRGGSRT